VTTYYAGQLLCGPCHFPNYRFDSTRVFTNKPPCGPKRGHGSVQPRFALEIQLDRLAAALDMDPIAFRRLNWQGENVTTVNGQTVTSNGFLQCLDAVEAASGWKHKRGKLPRWRGIGCAGSMYISGTNYAVYPNDMPQAGILVKLDRSGLATVFTGTSDIGQGCNSVMATIVAEELGLRLDQVRVVAADSDLCPVDLGAYSSRITLMAGNAAVDAARKLRKLVQQAVGEKLDIPPGGVMLADGFAFDRDDGERRLETVEAFQLAEAKFETLSAAGSYNTPERGGPYRGGTIGASPAYSFTAHVAEVELDPETGEIHVPKLWIAHDCGRAISPVQVEGQIEGSTYMGVAEALLESHEVYDDKSLPEAGLHRRPSLLEYTIPTSLDTPELEALIVESIDPEGPYGAKEAGEGPLHGSLPAIANAVFDACGVWLTRLPFTPPRVLRALREQGAAPGDPARAGSSSAGSPALAAAPAAPGDAPSGNGRGGR
jgi:CO/xanthine dehydrogenase Mo-binding subunit